MAKNRKAREHARGKRLAAKKTSAPPKQDSTAPTTDQDPNAGPSSGYRIASSSLAHAVEVFETPAPPRRESSTPRPKPSHPILVAAPPTVPLTQSTAVSQVDKIIASVHDLKHELLNLIEARKKTTSSPPSTTTREIEPGKRVGCLDALDEQCFHGPHCVEEQEAALAQSRREGAGPPAGQGTTSDAEMFGAWDLAPGMGDADNDNASPDVDVDVETQTTAINDHAYHTDNVAPPPDTQDIEPLGSKHNPTQTFLALPATSSGPITPVSPTFDMEHASSTSSQSSRSSVAGEGRTETATAPRQPTSRRRRGGRAIQRLGPSIMFRLFDDVLE
ncbi:hypothetical protein P171DRAFT_474090 [Karstenula rhodostoma CBS 690.94]|uniref:Uncharacterized protein n=1 Tax=Karstenula rhodostoma CBS 690.94 TaxID=1392251 RepID=A0A9P4UA49_9PLEO|nr:hypothetical protein P171DRAFT_474090 [Karstenula rhodostoma CBS 690.94]